MADQAVEALKTLGKTIGQMALYKVGHPAVAAMLDEAQRQLAEAIAQAGGELVLTIDDENVVVSGRVVAAAKDLPGGVSAVFTRFKLASLTFKPGVTHDDLASFCELASPRAGGAEIADPAKFLAERGVSNVALNEARYTKTDHGSAELSAAAREAAGGKPVEGILQARSVDRTIEALVERAVPDAAQRAAVLAKVMELVKQDIERRIAEVTSDLTREKKVLENDQQRTSSVLQNLVEGVVMVDDEGKILMMNAAAEQLYGATLAEVAGMPLTAKAGDDAVITMSADLTSPADRAISQEIKVAGSEDLRRAFKRSGAVVQNVEGKVVGMVTQLADVAKQKELDRMQRDFVAHVTHELRAPLSSIRAALEILQGEVMGKISEVEQRMIQTAIKNSDRLADLISTILDFSKIESGQMTVVPKKSDAEKIARDAVDSLAAWAAKKRLNLSLISAAQLPPVMADPSRTMQVLVNFMSNAIKFTPVGGTITVRAAPDGRFVRFSVVDTGPGIAKKDHGRVFEKFVQTDSAIGHAGGTGLGLTIAKALIEMQGGKIGVDSELGRGATFWFLLPVYTGEPQVTPPPKSGKRAWFKRLLGR
jgi:PAS domain S-box-containing protein